MSRARAELDAAKVMDVFTRQSQYLDELQKSEIAAVIARDKSQRDAQLTRFLVGNEGEDGVTLLKQDIDTRLALLLGDGPDYPKAIDADPAHPLWRQINNMGLDASLNSQLSDGYQRAVSHYRSDGGHRPTDCDTVLLGPPAGTDSQDARDDYKRLARRCTELDQARSIAEKKALVGFNGGSTQSIAAYGLYTPYAMAFSYPDAVTALALVRSRIHDQQAAANELDESLTKSEQDLQSSPDMKDSDRTELDQITGRIHDALTKSQTYLDNPFAQKIVADRVGQCVQVIVDATGPSTSSTQPAASSTPSASSPPSSATASASTPASSACGEGTTVRAAVALLQATAGVGDAFSSPPRIPHPNVLAVARAQLSYTREVASEEAADLQAQEGFDETQLDAITTTIYMLSRAKTELHAANIRLAPGQGLTDFLADPKTSHDAYRHATAALFYYTSAWNRGQIVADEALAFSNIAERRSVLERSRRATQAWLESITPGLDTLVQYGSGGIDPKTIAQIAGSLGLVGTAVGVNR